MGRTQFRRDPSTVVMFEGFQEAIDTIVSWCSGAFRRPSIDSPCIRETPASRMAAWKKLKLFLKTCETKTFSMNMRNQNLSEETKSENGWMSFVIIRISSEGTKLNFREVEKVALKLCFLNCQLYFSETCFNKKLLSTFTNTYIYYMYIYIYI